ncbi:hypothetical protein N7533_004590 [Penicillium manginii]|uniref:uncharacterized protein n=1 Tax=Penicillium manginii TaxID=203109 RepID=UPI0025477418|nr:uncharacterized protein N7533_004590 [Penicillium manginii]KAJ5755047.1 hypothetical protein N7533_004590 [Penicillium manginii]
MEDYFAYGIIVSVLTTVYFGSVLVYRLLLSPLAKFPGPRLAAATRLYEIYFQLIKGGTFTWHINDLHDKYGPVVRITPWEIHIKDPDYYNTLYAGPGKHRNKDPLFSYIGYPKSIFSLNSHEAHRPWRRILGHFLKKSAVQDLEPVIQENTQALCKHFSAAAKKKSILELYAVFHCFTSDTLSQHAFGRDIGFHHLDELELSDTWKTQVNTMFEFCRPIRHFNFMGDIAHLIPRQLATVLPPYAHVYAMEQSVRSRIQTLVDRYDKWEYEMQSENLSAEKSPFLSSPKAIYPAIMCDPNVPLIEKSQSRLEDDAIFLMFAGTDAPSQTSAITLFHLIDNPAKYQKLKNELLTAIPDMRAVPSLHQLEQIPYLGIRLASVVTTRLPRSAPDEILRYKEWDIPAGTFVSMSTYFILRDPKIFPEPTKFLPERWLLEPEELQQLERYLVPGSKGTLGCPGQSMNWSWMHHTIGNLVRRFDMVLHETTERNVQMVRDNFIGQTELGTHNVQVKVVEEYFK